MPPEVNPRGNEVPQPQPTSPAQAPTPNPSFSPLKQIRTFQGDVAEALARQNESLYSIQAKEHARNGGSFDGEKAKSAIPLLLGSLLLIAVAGIGAYLAYGEFQKKTAPPVVVTPESRFLPAESSADVDLTSLGRDGVIAAITQATTDVKDTELRYVDLKQGTSTETVEQFFGALDTQAPGSLVRALEPIFMFGTLGQSHFMIFKLASFPNAFAGMLAWEQTMPADIGALFNTSSILQALGPTPVFKDVVYKNKDLREISTISDGDGSSTPLTQTPVLLYSFYDNKMLIITDSPETLQTLIDRLTQESLTR